MGKLSEIKGIKKLGDVPEEFDIEVLNASFAEAFAASKVSISECAARREREEEEFLKKYGDIEIR
jgi:hypothetical protein